MVVPPNIPLKDCCTSRPHSTSPTSPHESPTHSTHVSPTHSSHPSPTHSANESDSHSAHASPTASASSSTPITPAHVPTTPVVAIKWAHKRHQAGSAMVADPENPKMPLLAHPRLTKGKVDECLKGDNGTALGTLLTEYGVTQVLRPHTDIPTASTLHAVASRGLCNCLAVLLREMQSSQGLDEPNDNGDTALMVGVSETQPEVVRQLLDAGAHVNARNNKGQSALHLAVAALSQAAKPEEDLFLTAKYLLARPDIDLEAHNDSHLTPLGDAARRVPQASNQQRENLIKICRSLVEKGASLEEPVGSSTVEEVLRSKSALHAVLMGITRGSAPARPCASRFLDLMIRNDFEKVKSFLIENTGDARVCANSWLGSQTVLFYAVNAGDEALVAALVAAGADPWQQQTSGDLPLHRAVATGNSGILDLLLQHMKSKRTKKVELEDQGYEILRRLVTAKRIMSSDKENNSKCMNLLLQPDVNINYNKTFNDKSILHEAASFNHQDALCSFLQKGAFLGHQWGAGSVLESLQPHTLTRAMDGCINNAPSTAAPQDKETENILDDDYTLRLDYRFLVPPLDAQKAAAKPLNEMQTLMEVSKSWKHRHAIKHPLVETLLFAKWRKALPFYLLNLLLYLVFVAILTAFVYALKDLRIFQARIIQQQEKEGVANSTLVEEAEQYQSIVSGLMAVLVPLTLYMLVREAAQIYLIRTSYFKSIDNYLECFLIALVLVLCLAPLPVDWTRHLGAWAMIFAWYEFVLMLGRAPHLALYITMLRHVSYNFIKFIFLYGALVIAFTISFNIILAPTGTGETTEFSDFWSALPKAIVMATGEFEYSDLKEQFSSQILFLTSNMLMFLVFLFVFFLVLMNVMNALAITDTQEVVEDARLYSLMCRLELVYLIEATFLSLPCLHKHSHRVQLLTGPHNDPVLLAKVNKMNKGERLVSGRTESGGPTFIGKLDNTTANNLKNHRLHHLEKEEQEQRGDPAGECLTLLRELQSIVTRSPDALQRAAASLT